MQFVHCASVVAGSAFDRIEQATLVIDGELVLAVEPGWTLPAEGHVVDLKTLHVLPGLVDGHDHFGIDMGDGEAEARQDPQYRALKGASNARTMLRTGITTLRNAGELYHLAHQMRIAIEQGRVAGPRVVTSGTPICSTGGHGWFVGMEVDGVDAVRRAVRDNVKAGADMIKMIITGGVTTPGGELIRTCFSEAEIHAGVEEAHFADRRVGVHCYGGDAATWAIAAGVDSVEHGTYLTDAQLDEMARRGTFLVCTSSVMKAAAATPTVAAFMRERFHQVSLDYLALMVRARERGIKVAVGSDTNHGGLPDEVETLLAAGYTSREALRAATLGGAELCGMQAKVGSLERGKLADFIAVEGDPEGGLGEALRSVQAVYKGGHRSAELM